MLSLISQNLAGNLEPYVATFCRSQISQALTGLRIDVLLLGIRLPTDLASMTLLAWREGWIKDPLRNPAY